MEISIISFVIVVIAVAGMAIGVLLSGAKRCIKGSCGGIANLPGMEGGCGACRRSMMQKDKRNS
uniref:(Na+)-NQR maturation NqrM n=1 Tax=Candidatus Kentrum eta TaxID=2126337 RepID=A0A450VK53_9GAMM|nr:MAG: hypothetical protein BECKH772B_GA0070898_105041 [Candidatus Kentron sp. H]VFK05158.1 MAG: hypothetical protein BECKH772A_GA0070896_105111 [Candidatus Kentron sp. H]VFK08383.1 MAG: hypothetical protein BECKH772C_GA0070978_105071 [Candidatus Kentron sp. H]